MNLYSRRAQVSSGFIAGPRCGFGNARNWWKRAAEPHCQRWKSAAPLKRSIVAWRRRPIPRVMQYPRLV